MLHKDIVNKTQLSLSFDFNSAVNRRKIANQIASKTKLPVKYSDNFKVLESDANYILVTRNDVGGKNMSKVQFPFLPYYEAINNLYQTLDYIDASCYTTDKCRGVFQVRLDNTNIASINRIKLLSAIDECQVSSRFFKPRYMDNYINSLSYIIPSDINICESNSIDTSTFNNYTVKTSNKTLLNTDKLNENIVSLKCQLGKDYQKHKSLVSDFIDGLVSNVFTVIKENNQFNLTEKAKLVNVVKRHANIHKTIRCYKDFKKNYGKDILFDENAEDKILKMVYESEIKPKIFGLLAYTDIKINECTFNYCMARKRLQIMGANIKEGFVIEGLDFVNSSLANCEFKDCAFGDTLLDNSFVNECEARNGNEFKNCTITDVAFHGIMNTARGCFIRNNKDLLVEATLIRCVVDGTICYGYHVDEWTEIL